MRVIDIKKLAKKYYTRNQIRYASWHGMSLCTPGMVPDGCEYRLGIVKGNGTTVSLVKVNNKEEYCLLDKAVARRAEKVIPDMPSEEEVNDFCARQDRISKIRARKVKNNKAITSMLNECGCRDAYDVMFRLNLGANRDIELARYDDHNGISCVEYNDWNAYGRSCRYPMVRRSFTLHIRKGYTLHSVGGVLTFIRGSRIDRSGMSCEWIEQGRAISDIRTIKGYLVRGEHIQASSLKQARAINAKHRSEILSNILEMRANALENRQHRDEKTVGQMRITYADSIAAGNCMAGTNEFVRRFTEAIGYNTDYITVDELRKYGREFCVSSYANRVINYVLNK